MTDAAIVPRSSDVADLVGSVVALVGGRSPVDPEVRGVAAVWVGYDKHYRAHAFHDVFVPASWPDADLAACLHAVNETWNVREPLYVVPSNAGALIDTLARHGIVAGRGRPDAVTDGARRMRWLLSKGMLRISADCRALLAQLEDGGAHTDALRLALCASEQVLAASLARRTAELASDSRAFEEGARRRRLEGAERMIHDAADPSAFAAAYGAHPLAFAVRLLLAAIRGRA